MTDRNTTHKGAELLSLKLGASATAETGHMGAVNAAGYGVPATDTAGLTVMGVFEETVTNDGANGDVATNVRRKRMFLFGNDGTNPVTQADFGKDVFVKTSTTVCVAAGATNDIVAGKCMGLEGNLVWVAIG